MTKDIRAQNNQVRIADDLLHGAHEIAAFTGLTERAVYALGRRREIPVFRLGGKLAARRSELAKRMTGMPSEAAD